MLFLFVLVCVVLLGAMLTLGIVETVQHYRDMKELRRAEQDYCHWFARWDDLMEVDQWNQ